MNDVGHSIPVRLLLDPGAQASFITKRCADNLRLTRQRKRMPIAGIGEVVTTTLGRTTVVLKSRANPSFRTRIDVHILDKIATNIPEEQIRCDFVSDLPLADPDFRTPAPVDLLIGADALYKFVDAKEVIVGSPLRSVSTELGIVVFGPSGSVDDLIGPTLPVPAVALVHGPELGAPRDDECADSPAVFDLDEDLSVTNPGHLGAPMENAFGVLENDECADSPAVFNSVEDLSVTNPGHLGTSRLCVRADMSPLLVGATVGAGPTNEYLDQLLERFWRVEEPAHVELDDEHECERIFKDTTYREPDGRYVVQIPFKSNATIGQSHQQALRQFHSLERRFASDVELHGKYRAFMKEYAELGHMEVSSEQRPSGYFIPHHAVTSKFRVVFNASAKSSNGVSLNDAQLVGPPVQDTLLNIIMRFRLRAVAITADVEKMFRQILVDPRQRHWQQVLWRDNPGEKLLAYRLNTITYGMASSPFVAVRVLKQCADDNQSAVEDCGRGQRAHSSIVNNFYVDDFLHSVDSAEEAAELAHDIDLILRRGHLHLRKWNSNDRRAIDRIATDRPELETGVVVDDTAVLGVRWDPVADEIFYRINLEQHPPRPTKRAVLSEISRCFDPLGLLGPIMIRGRVLVQSLWKEKLDWDTPLPEELAAEWTSYRQDLEAIDIIRIPRWTGYQDGFTVSLHGFCDASQKAYGAVVYLKTVNNAGVVNVRLLASKARVVPVQTLTIPRLELSAAVVLVELLDQVRIGLRMPNVECHLWSDSTIVLAWINKPLEVLKQYVANRVKVIRDKSDSGSWRHIRTAANPADLVSRGASPLQLLNSSLWWMGPDCIHHPEKCIGVPDLSPEELQRAEDELKPVPVKAHLTMRPLFTMTRTAGTREPLRLVDRFSSLTRLLHTMARILRWLPRYRTKRNDPITAEESNAALLILLREEQGADFQLELKLIQANQQSILKGPTAALAPIVVDGILRVGGRLHNAELSADEKHPVIISKHGRLATLIIAEAHKDTLHGGLQVMLQWIRQRFWIINGRAVVKSFIHRCVVCRRHQRKGYQQQMATLPRNRVIACPPFTNTGVDYAGPFLVRHGPSRRTLTKCYAAIFVCLSTKAVHIELPQDLSSRSFLDAFDRFISRRGMIRTLLSDNGTQFKGADRLMREDVMNWRASSVQQTIEDRGVKWTFITPSSPHHGGIWEAAVKSAKKHLLRVMGKQSMEYIALNTLLIRIEACLNSRPLCRLYDDPDGGTALTPGHFIIGRPMITRIHPSADSDLPINRLRYYQRIQRMMQHFWSRWSREYLVHLQSRNKWLNPQDNVQVGDIVVVMDDNMTPNSWRLGRIVETHAGSDALVRSATLEVVGNSGTKDRIKRCVQKLCKLMDSQ